MMSVEHRARAQAPRDVVWEVLTDSANYASWGLWDETSVERPGSPDPNGVGQIRVLRTGKRVLREEILTFEPPTMVRYSVLDGIPMKDYVGKVVLNEDGGATEIHWSSEFRFTPLLGWLVKPRMTGIIRDVAESMAREAERRAQA